MKKMFLLVLAFVAVILTSCKNDNANEASFYTAAADCSAVVASTNTYDQSVSAILNASCAYAGCHDNNSKEAGVILDTYASAKASFLDGKSLCTIHHDCKKMPEGGSKLSDAIIEQLTCWVKEGCPQ
jgi:hypothetical protein